MKKETLQFLRRQREEIRSDLGLLESGQREVIEVSKAGRINVTMRAIQRLLDRLSRFEELIAAYEAGLA
ncbi:MAG: hypothetical protein Q8R02_19445 [Hyphomonadaceae bacterium]|nr:hypothetical protein [Hyphomonadaceae bacterium]